MGSYVPTTAAEQEQMLAQVGVKSLNDLYAAVPQEMFLHNGLNLPEGLSELEVREKVTDLAEKNKVFKTVLRGAGSYRHFIPAVVKVISVDDCHCLLPINNCLLLCAKSVDLYLFFKKNQRCVAVVASKAELFTSVNTVHLFKQSLVVKIIKIKTANLVSSVDCVRVLLHNSRQPRPQSEHIAIAYLVLKFVSEVHVYHSLAVFVVYSITGLP